MLEEVTHLEVTHYVYDNNPNICTAISAIYLVESHFDCNKKSLSSTLVQKTVLDEAKTHP